MYERPFICEGDTVTPGAGNVQPAFQSSPTSYYGKLACYEGDPVYCETCKTWGVTKCVPPFRRHTDMRGRQSNLDGDLCLCKCPTPPRLQARSKNVCMRFEGHELAAMPGSIPWLAYAGHPMEAHDIIYEIVDAKTGEAIEGMTYKLASANSLLLDREQLAGGKSRPYSVHAHPHLTFIAWIEGPNK